MATAFQAKSVSGFPEWLPGARRTEKDFIRTLEEIYESYGYSPIETAAVEKVGDLTTGGDVGKEIFGVFRLSDDNKKCEYGLHFDQTLPFARYVAGNAGQLSFPFKRYQIQKVWRGERPQAGRFREFAQADIDIVGDGTLPLHYEAEVVEILHDIFTRLNVGDFTVRINNRKILEGLYRQAGIADMNETLIIVDKIDKIGAEKVQELLIQNGCDAEQAAFCTEIAAKKMTLTEGLAYVEALEATNELLEQAKVELTSIFSYLSHLPEENIIFDLSIARGLDYYTGSVYECTLKGLEKYGSVCSGGRYDNLAQKFSKKQLPGVGLSIGLTRLLYILFKEGILEPERACPSDVCVVLFSEDQRKGANALAHELRQSGLKVEVSAAAKKLGKQIQVAQKKGIRFVIIPEEDGTCNMKDLELGEQTPLNLEVIHESLKK